MPTTKKSMAVIGGGILGMTLALRLRQAGHQVDLFEAAPDFGGLASPWSLGEFTWDKYYHVTLLSDSHLRGLLDELNLDQETEWVETRTGFYTGGQLHSMSNSLEFLRFPPLGLIDKFRLGATIFYASKIKNWKRLEKINVCDWLRKLSGKRTFEKIWLPLLKAKLGANYDKVSAAFIWAIIARMYAARRSGLKKEMFGYVRGGYRKVLEGFVERLQREEVNLEAGQPVSSIRRVDGKVEVHGNAGLLGKYDDVAVTLPAPVASRICEGLSTEETDRLNGISYQGIVCASAVLKKPVAGFYVTNITDEWVPFTAVIEMSALVDRDAAFEGNTLIYLPKYVPRGDDFFKTSDDEIREEFTSALLKMYPHLSPSDIVAFRIARATDVHALSVPGYSETLPPQKTSVPGLHIVNSAHIINGTLNVNETIALAERAASELAA
ncbi:MAG: NAD(P)/FAD-dependent oxidoreductase [Verrucomicrobiota bacterium]